MKLLFLINYSTIQPIHTQRNNRKRAIERQRAGRGRGEGKLYGDRDVEEGVKKENEEDVEKEKK